MKVDKQDLLELVNRLTEKVREVDPSLSVVIQDSPRGNLDCHLVTPNNRIYQTFEMDFTDKEYPCWYVVRYT